MSVINIQKSSEAISTFEENLLENLGKKKLVPNLALDNLNTEKDTALPTFLNSSMQPDDKKSTFRN